MPPSFDNCVEKLLLISPSTCYSRSIILDLFKTITLNVIKKSSNHQLTSWIYCLESFLLSNLSFLWYLPLHKPSWNLRWGGEANGRDSDETARRPVKWWQKWIALPVRLSACVKEWNDWKKFVKVTCRNINNANYELSWRRAMFTLFILRGGTICRTSVIKIRSQNYCLLMVVMRIYRRSSALLYLCKIWVNDTECLVDVCNEQNAIYAVHSVGHASDACNNMSQSAWLILTIWVNSDVIISIGRLIPILSSLVALSFR